MVLKSGLKFAAPAHAPFLLERRVFSTLIRSLLRENLPLLPELERIESPVRSLNGQLREVMPKAVDAVLLDWLIADIGSCARRMSEMAGTASLSVRLEKAVDRTCPRFHVDSVVMRLLCTYCGPGTEWADPNTAYAANFGKPFDELLIRHIPSEAVVVYGGARSTSELGPLWHRSPAVPEGETRLVLCVDPL